MSVSFKTGGTWHTVSQPYIKYEGAWKAAAMMAVRTRTPVRYPREPIAVNILQAPALWTLPYGDPTQPAAVVEGAAMRLTWTVAAGKKALRGPTAYCIAGRNYTLTVTCSSAAGEWEAAIRGIAWDELTGNRVTGAGTSTINFTAAKTSTPNVGIQVFDSSDGTAGHLVTSITFVDNSPSSPLDSNTVVPFSWAQVWPQPGTGSPKIVGVRKQAANWSYGYASSPYIRYNDEDHFLNNKFNLPQVPFYRVMGDTSQIASAKVTLRFTPVAPKDPVEHTISWDAPVGWALYHVGYMGNDGYARYYYAALTDAEATTLRGQTNRYVTKMWSPKEGGWFVWSPVCWDVSGVTVPMRAEADSTSAGTDPYSGYTPFPPNVSATSALADYTVSNGYSDMSTTAIEYTAVTVELKNSGGTVLHSWTGSLATGYYEDLPGLGSTPPALFRRMRSDELPELYWPEEWRGLFDGHIEGLPQRLKVVYSHDTIHGWAVWNVLSDMDESKDRDAPDWQKIGDFRLALHRGFPDVIEIGGVNLQPDLIGMKIMRSIVEHGVLYCPTPYVVVKPPDEMTFEVMRSWGWKTLDEDSEALLHAFWMHGDEEDDPDRYLGMESNPYLNRFFLLDMPSSEEVDPWRE